MSLIVYNLNTEFHVFFSSLSLLLPLSMLPNEYTVSVLGPVTTKLHGCDIIPSLTIQIPQALHINAPSHKVTEGAAKYIQEYHFYSLMNGINDAGKIYLNVTSFSLLLALWLINDINIERTGFNGVFHHHELILT